MENEKFRVSYKLKRMGITAKEGQYDVGNVKDQESAEFSLKKHLQSKYPMFEVEIDYNIIGKLKKILGIPQHNHR